MVPRINNSKDGEDDSNNSSIVEIANPSQVKVDIADANIDDMDPDIPDQGEIIKEDPENSPYFNKKLDGSA